MRILKPEGTLLEIEDLELQLLFTADVIDDVQDHFDNDIVSLLNSMRKDPRKGYKTMTYTFMSLINSAIERQKLERAPFTYEEISKTYITNATAITIIPFIISIFNNDTPNNEDPNAVSEQAKNEKK